MDAKYRPNILCFFIHIFSFILSCNVYHIQANQVINPGETVAYADAVTNSSSNNFTINQNESIDPFSGTLKLSYKDFSAKVAPGLEMSYTRSYISDVYGGDLFHYNKHGQYNFITQSWTFHQGYIRFPKNCKEAGNVCKPVFITGDNERIILLADKNKPGFYRTQNNWCGGVINNNFVLTAPNGYKYYFNHHYDLSDSSRKYLTRIETPDGNFLKFTYKSIYIETITSNNPGQELRVSFDIRDIKLGKRKSKVFLPSRLYYNNRLVAEYINGELQHAHMKILVPVSAKLKDGRWWNYHYGDTDLRTKYDHQQRDKFYKETLESVSDAAGTSSYSYIVDWGTRASMFIGGFRVSKVIRTNIRGVENGVWDFKYTLGKDKDGISTHITNITNNYYSISNRYYAYQNNKLWLTGLLVDSTVYKDKIIENSNIIQKEEYTWDKVLYNNEPYKINIFLVQDGTSSKRDEKTYKAILKSKKVIRDGEEYLTEYLNYNDYGAPLGVRTSNSKISREIKQEYYHIEDKNILNLPSIYSINNKLLKDQKYDNYGHLIEESSLGKVNYYQYDSQGNLSSKTDVIGNTEQYSNYKFGVAQNILYSDGTVESKLVDDKGDVVSSTDKNNYTTQYKVDNFGRVLEKTPPIGYVSQYNYPSAGTSKVQTGSYIEETYNTGFGLPLVKNLGKQKQIIYLYDALGRKVYQSVVLNPNDKKDTLGRYYKYDSLDRVTKECFDSDFTVMCTVYDYLNNHKTKITYPNGEYKVLEYISYDNIDDKKIHSIEEAGRNTSIKRDGIGYIISVEQCNITKNYEYDNNYNLIQYTEPETGVTKYSYDSLGNVIEINKNNHKIFNTYNTKNNRLLGIHYSDDSADVSYSYDNNGNIIKTKKGDIVKSYVYDALNRITSESLEINKYKNFIKNKINTPVVLYDYNPNGYLSSLAYPDGSKMELNPDEYGMSTVLGEYAGNIEYYSNGLIKSYSLANHTEANLLLDEYKRIQQYSYGSLDLNYNYDSNNNLKNLNIKDSNQPGFDYKLYFDYDLMGRIIKSASPWEDIEYSYDQNDNIININEKIFNINNPSVKPELKKLNFTYSQLRLDKIADSNKYLGKNVERFGYDLHGNIKQDSYYYYHYGLDGNLLYYNGWNAANYQYDANNHRIVNSKRSGYFYNDIVSFYSKSGELLFEYDFINNKTAKYIYLNGNKIAKEESKLNTDNKDIYYYYNDAIGSPVAMADSQGKILWREVYKPYGSTRQIEDHSNLKDKKSFNRHWFAGKEVDENDLSYFGARYYNKLSGRFMTPDPVPVNPEKPTTFNRYSYANNNPYKYVDPDGELPFIMIGIAIIAKIADMAITSYDTAIAYQSEGAYGAGKALAFAGAVSAIPGGKVASKILSSGAGKIVATASKLENPRVQQFEKIAEGFLGKDYIFKLNKKGDPIFINTDNTKRIRFDVKYSHGDAPHGHVEMKSGRRWVDYTSQHRIYVKE